MNQEMKISQEYKVKGGVLGVAFEHDVYVKDGWNEEDIMYHVCYMYGEGNYSCDCNKRIFAGHVGDYNCGDEIKYDSLKLVYKDSRVLNMLEDWRFTDDT